MGADEPGPATGRSPACGPEPVPGVVERRDPGPRVSSSRAGDRATAGPEIATTATTEVTVSDPTVQVSDNPAASRYEIRVGDHLAGFADYARTHGVIVFTHTEVEPGFQGQGLATRLAAAALDDVRTRGLTVTPLCPFIAAFIKTHPGYADLVAHQPRAHR